MLAQARVPTIGIIGPVTLQRSNYAPGIVGALGELGYRDGAGARIEYRHPDNVADRYPRIARDLLDLKCDLIIAVGVEPPVRALQAAGSPIPIVFLAVDYDPVAKGVVTSLRKPDRNTTGLYVQQTALVAKRVEVMREVLPSARRFVTFVDVFSRDQLDSARRAAEASKVELGILEFDKPPYDYEKAMESPRKATTQAFTSLASPVFNADREKLAALFLKHRMPSIGTTVQQANAGFLFSLGADVLKTTQRVAEIAVRILKGAKPADIPVELADQFELAVNSKTAKALGVRVPESVRARATRIVA